MNFRKWICRFDLSLWVFRFFGCDRYEPKLIHTKICQDSLLLPRKCCRNIMPAVFVGEEMPTKLCNLHKYKTVKICTETGKRANKYCPKIKMKKFCPDKIPSICRKHKAPRIRVKICLDSGLLAGSYCPINKVVWKKFIKGKEPTKYCNIHIKPKPKSPKLAIHDGRICYRNGGNTPITLLGVSRWEALMREKKLWHNWGNKDLAWYEEQLIKSGINYVRHGIVPDLDLVRSHCQRMGEAGIIVELTIYNSQVDYNLMGNPRKAVDATIDLPNVFYDVHNEFLNNERDVQIAKDLIEYIRNKGGICSAGAWSGKKGKHLSGAFHSYKPPNQIESHHREWTITSFQQTLKYGKPVVMNEYFAFKQNLSLKQTKQIMKNAVEAGFQAVQYYGFRDQRLLPDLEHSDPFDNNEMLYWTGKFCQEINR